ncbi:MAG: phosphoglucosamine mutase, partial [Terriglobia bacterium]
MPAKPELFGTDGVRGVAGQYPLDRDTVTSLGRALAVVLAAEGHTASPEVVLGQDTRESGPWIARALAAGLGSAGAKVASVGVITTPGVAYLTRRHGFAAGVMVSASHNPFEDNGIKVFSSAGTKFPEQAELEVERVLRSFAGRNGQASDLPGEPSRGLMDDYLEFLESLAPPDGAIGRLKLVVDCANGSASALAPALMKRLRIEARIINSQPDGRNINLNCGALYPRQMAETTREGGGDFGVALDGDADRAIFACPVRGVLDGDHVLFAMAPFLRAKQALKGGAVVGTLMTNLALELALKARSIGLKRAAVGDKFVLDEMVRSGINLGGEPSGHIIFSDISSAGDGLITLLQMLRLLAETGEPASELMRGYTPFPQIILGGRVKEKPPLECVPAVASALACSRDELGERGRVVLRYSG